LVKKKKLVSTNMTHQKLSRATGLGEEASILLLLIGEKPQQWSHAALSHCSRE
jgi:hypothetical protein